jgi:hypothetical protein
MLVARALSLELTMLGAGEVHRHGRGSGTTRAENNDYEAIDLISIETSLAAF